MKVLILAAGYGTRLAKIAENTPKPLLPINERPLINYILDRIEHLNGLTEVLVVTNDKFFGHFQDWAKNVDFPFPISVINDGTLTPEDRLGSIGDINFAIKNKGLIDDVLVVGGDNLFDFNLDEYVVFAQNQQKSVIVGLYDVGSLEEATKFGVVELDNNQKITSFEEKPAKPRSSLIGMCVYYLPKKSLGLVSQYLLESGKSDTAGDYIRWLHEKTDVFGFNFTGKWYDIGSVESYREAQQKFIPKDK